MHRRWRVTGVTLGAAALLFVGLNAPASHASHLVVFPDAVDGTTYTIVPAFRAQQADTPNCLRVDDDLDSCGAPGTRFTLAYDQCWSTKLTCYQLANEANSLARCVQARADLRDLAAADCQRPNWIGQGSLALRWRVNTFGESGLIQLRPASNTGLCLAARPDQPGDFGRGAVELADCASTAETAKLWFLVPHAENMHINSSFTLSCWQVVDPAAASSTIVQHMCENNEPAQKFGIAPVAYPRWSGGDYEEVSRAALTIYFGQTAKCVNPGGSASQREALTVGGCTGSGRQGVLELRPTPGYTSFQFRPLVSPSMAIDLSVGGGGGFEEGRRIQYYAADPDKENQQWYILPSSPWDATHGALSRL